MPQADSLSNRILISMLIFLLPCLSIGLSQDRQEPSDVIRVYTDIVQTDVMVFDKQGRFVEGLRKEDFEIQIDGKPKEVDFLELVRAGKVSEDSQLLAARGSGSLPANNLDGPVPLDRGGTVFFYVDDLHLDPAGLAATQKVITSFIDKEMGQNDEAAITSASGQIGFLQQLTYNKSVLHAALKRIKLRPYSVKDYQTPIMSEYQALLIDRYDRDLTDYFVEETIRMNPGMTREMAENYVRSRARVLLQQATHVTANTLTGLENLVRTSNALPGRKIVFFISGGFFLDHNQDSVTRLRRITSAAARSGVIIYSMDARGLVASLEDAGTGTPFDPSGRLQRANHSELRASQDSLHALAKDTGGQAILNTNVLEPGLSRALEETAVYYLVGWKPDRQSQNSKRFRQMEVKISGRPDLIVRVRRGFYDREPAPVVLKAAASKPETPAVKLQHALNSVHPVRDLSVWLKLNYVKTTNQGLMLAVSMQVGGDFLSPSADGKFGVGVVDIVGKVFNDRGQVGANFSEQVTMRVPAGSSPGSSGNFAYTHNIFLGPGLYHVRASAHDRKTGRVGSAHAWIDVPNLSDRKLVLSSLMVGERTSDHENNPTNDQIRGSVDQRFQQDSNLSFIVFIYNAAKSPSDSKPDIALQVQVIRDNQPVMTTALKKISTEGVDLERLPYAAMIPLNFPHGRYLLRVTAIDRIAKSSAVQETQFEIAEAR